MSKLKIVSDEASGGQTVRERVDGAIAKRRANMLELVKETLIYFAIVGRRKVYLEEFPPIHPIDTQFLLEWLSQEGFDVRRTKIGGRVTVILQ